MLVLVINSGSSSIKLRLFQNQKGQLTLLANGFAEAINLPNSQFTFKSTQSSETIKLPIKNHTEALAIAMQQLRKKQSISTDKIALICHRVVHGGEKYQRPILITPRVLQEIKKISPLAPLHNPANITCIEASQQIFPGVKQVAVFDTAFHATLPEEAYLYALPPQLYSKFGIRRYGFHGINHQYVSEEAIKILRHKKLPYRKLITVHLGNGCSMTAIKNGKSIDTSMGYTPLQGLIMGTRSGDVDPALITVLAQRLKITPDGAEDYLNEKSGILGVSGLSSDMRTIYASAQKDNLRAQLAIRMFSRRIGQYLNSYIGILGGVDAIIFTGGIGEHAFYVRDKALSYLKHLGILLDSRQNKANKLFINSAKSKAKIIIIPANEELEIAKQALQLISA